MKHTPGPWRYEGATKTIRSTPANYWVATMDSWDGAVDNVANARLIAAAPEMLDVLKVVKAHLDWVTQETRRKWSMRDQRMYEAVEAVIEEVVA